MSNRTSLLQKASQFNTDLSNTLGFDKLNKAKNDALDYMDEGIQNNIVNPITEAGYPNVGAGIGTAISAPVRTVADIALPDSAATAAITLLPFGKVTKLFDPATESRLIATLRNSGKMDSDEAVKKALLEAEAFQLSKSAIPNPAVMQRETKAAEQMAAFNPVKKPDNIVHSASDTSRLPRATESAKRYESTVDEYARRERLKQKASE